MKTTDLSTAKLASFYKAISCKVRLDILNILFSNNNCSCVCTLAKLLSKNQSVIYKHVIILEKEGLISTHKDNKYLMCCIKNKKLCEKVLYSIN